VRFLTLLALSAPLMAQALSAGLRAGMVATPFFTFHAAQQELSSRWTIGACVELHLWRGAGVAVDLLLRRPGLELAAARAKVTMWQAEAPVTLIYRFRSRMKPFLRAGVAFNRIFDINGATVCARGPFGEQFYCVGGNRAAELRHRGASGFVAGGGIGWKANRLRIEPEVRVTHWLDRNFGVRDSQARSNLNQASLLVGLIF
jgi:hypothetical protein